jgi:hypothetical protein
MIPGWLSDLLGFRAAVDASNVEYPSRRLLRFLGASVFDNETLGTTDVTVGAPSIYWVSVEAPHVAADRFAPVLQGVPPLSTEAPSQWVVVRPFIATYFSFMCGFTPLATDTLVATIRKNGVDSAMVLSIPAGSPQGTIVADTAHSVSFARGDKVSLKLRQSGTAVQAAWHGLFQLG